MLARMLGKTVAELTHVMPLTELTDWIAFLTLEAEEREARRPLLRPSGRRR